MGVFAGLVGIGCCVYPVVVFLLGLSTAAAAVDLGNTLFVRWGWAFRAAGVAAALLALWIQRRRVRACPVEARPTLVRSGLWTAIPALVTYAAVYAVTSYLGDLAS